jgi:hypothetical protein
MINNHKKALPQYGLGSAASYTNAWPKGNLPFVAIFKSYASLRKSPVRSARHYYIDLALNHPDVIYIHYGGSPQVTPPSKTIKSCISTEFTPPRSSAGP